MQHKFFQQRHVPGLLLWVVLLCYGVFIFWFGFYGDDWSYVWYQHLLGWGGPGSFAALDRPLSAPFYNVVITLLGENPFPYHVLNLLLRWACSLFFWLILKKLWPKRPQMAVWAAILLAVYPGFSQQPIAVEFILHFFVLATFLLSMYLMIEALEHPKKVWWLTLLGMVCAANMFSLEYFVGLELLRPVFLFILLRRTGLSTRQSLYQALLKWLPYILVLGGFLYWRVFVFKFPTYKLQLLDGIKTAPLATFIGLLKRIIIDLKTVLYNAWKQTLTLSSKGWLFAFLVSVGGIISLGLFFWRFEKNDVNENKPFQKSLWKEWGWEPLGLGIFALCIAGWPFWVSGLEVALFFPWDRSILPFMMGAALTTVGFFNLVLNPKLFTPGLLILTAFSLSYHSQNAVIYREETQKLRQFFWQLTWRVPGLQTGTILLTDNPPLSRFSDNNLNGPFNWTYAPDQHSRQLGYKFFDLLLRYGAGYSGVPAFEEGLAVTHDYRTLLFSSTTSDMLAVYYSPTACLRVLDAQDVNLPGITENLGLAAPLSKPDHILVNPNVPAVPPTAIGAEPSHNWCYSFEKMDLAGQMKDWDEVIRLGEDADHAGLTPNNPSEMMPLIEAYAMTQAVDKAVELAQPMKENPVFQTYLCDQWKKIIEEAQEQSDTNSLLTDAALNLGCTP